MTAFAEWLESRQVWRRKRGAMKKMTRRCIRCPKGNVGFNVACFIDCFTELMARRTVYRSVCAFPFKMSFFCTKYCVNGKSKMRFEPDSMLITKRNISFIIYLISTYIVSLISSFKTIGKLLEQIRMPFDLDDINLSIFYFFIFFLHFFCFVFLEI
jgi:hypothetical protein